MTTALHIFLINLDSSTARLDTARAALKAQGAAFTRISAYDGRGKDLNAIPEYSAPGAHAYMARDLNGGEVGCYFSHMRAAEAFLNTGAAYGLVLEDDASPTTHAMAVVNALVTAQTSRGGGNWHLCHLAASRLKFTTPTQDIRTHDGQSHRLVQAHYFPITTTALLWSRPGAQAFLDSALPITAPVDVAMRRWLTKTDMGVALTPPVFRTTDAASEIDTADLQRRREGRLPLYGWRKFKRLNGDKARAIKHMIQRRFLQKGLS